jgi:hypothetical protein
MVPASAPPVDSVRGLQRLANNQWGSAVWRWKSGHRADAGGAGVRPWGGGWHVTQSSAKILKSIKSISLIFVDFFIKLVKTVSFFIKIESNYFNKK